LQDIQPRDDPDGGPVTAEARVVLFGYPDTEAVARVHDRDALWRGSRAAVLLGVGVLLAPVVALVPPHAPWAIGALGVGAILARKKWRERRTLVELEGICPRCESPLRVERPTRMRDPHTFSCNTCHHEMELEVRGHLT